MLNSDCQQSAISNQYSLSSHSERKLEVALDSFEILDIRHLRGIGSTANLLSQLVEFFLRTRRGELHAAVLSVSNPARQSESPAGNSHEPAKANPLHPPSHQEMHGRHALSPAHSEQHRERGCHGCFRPGSVRLIDHQLPRSNTVRDSVKRACDLVG